MRLLGELFEAEAMHLMIESFAAFLAAMYLVAVAYPIVAAIVPVVTET